MVESKTALPGGEVETAVSLHRRSDLPNHSSYFKDLFCKAGPSHHIPISSQPLFVCKFSHKGVIKIFLCHCRGHNILYKTVLILLFHRLEVMFEIYNIPRDV